MNASTLNLSSLIPLAVVAAEPWHLLAAVVLGVILSGTVLRPDITTILSQLSDGHLH